MTDYIKIPLDPTGEPCIIDGMKAKFICEFSFPVSMVDENGNDIYVNVPVPFVTAALGGEIEIPTLKGKAVIKIPAGTQGGKIFRLKQKGIPDLNGYETGNQNVIAQIDVPKKLNKKQKELLREFSGTVKKKKGWLF